MRHARTTAWIVVASVLMVLGVSLIAQAQDHPAAAAAEQVKPEGDWAMNATIIEACSCPMFCQCYFDTKPAAHAGHAGHGGEHFCKFNNAYKVNHGHYGDTKLDGAKYWASGDLGSDFGDGSVDWMMLTFDPSVTPAQREGIKAIMGHVYPVKIETFIVADDKPIEWNATRDRAEAKLDDGKAAEVVLKKNQGISDEPIVIQNLLYFGAPRNEGFVLMQNEVEALRQAPQGKEPYEFRGTNGFIITFDISSKDMAETKHSEGDHAHGMSGGMKQ